LQDLSDRLNYSFNHHYALSDVNAMIHIFENEFTDLKDLRNKIIAVGYQTKVFLIE
jgi:hypothetical protein